MNLIFTLIAALLVAGVTLWLGFVLWRGPKLNSTVDHHMVNAAVLRDQLVELEQDRTNGTLSSTNFAEAKQDLQRRVLDETTPAQAAGLQRQGSKYAAITLIVLLPVAATLTYLSLGNLAVRLPLNDVVLSSS
ncbi:c-type cytochrome biogenesis protein CcmI [Allopusillimonas ginsengisoli]|nr:c-type cytochrome biogenesis protein CcmI [Allopusillimonas ginsengisoli]